MEETFSNNMIIINSDIYIYNPLYIYFNEYYKLI